MTERRVLTQEERDSIAKVYATQSSHARWLVMSIASAVAASVALVYGLKGLAPSAALCTAGLLYGLTLPSGLKAGGGLSNLLCLVTGPVKFLPRLGLALREVKEGHAYLKSRFDDN